MVIQTSSSTIFTGRVGVFNYNESNDSRKIFWVDGDNWRSGWCKGHVTTGRELRSGNRVRLNGRWKIDEKYQAFDVQFFFSSYEILSELDVTIEDSDDKPLPDTELGCIARVTNRDGTARIFFLGAANGKRIHCVGRVMPGREIFGGDYLKVTGTWKDDIECPENGKSFFFTEYERISKDTAETLLSGEKQISPVETPAHKQQQIEHIHQFLREIGKKEVPYAFHGSTAETIAEHAKTQLYDRIIESSPQAKDFFFLTAFLDRNVRDAKIQDFRKRHPDFKQKLIQCWNEAPETLRVATEGIGKAVQDKDKVIIQQAVGQSKTFAYLRKALPGRSRDNQLLICLKIINEQYQRQNNITCSNLFKTLRAEALIRDDLLRIYGVGPKLANWSIANATGHWFVIDLHIQKVIIESLRNTLLQSINIAAENADLIFRNWFGIFDEHLRCYSEFTQDDFVDVFPTFAKKDCEYLPFILTQYLWFYGKFIGG